MGEFIDEDDMSTFEGWMRYQGARPSTPEETEEWRQGFEEARARAAITPKVGLMKLENAPGKKYAVAVRNGSDLWLTLWVRRAPNGEVFVMVPRGKGAGNPHASYHLDGNFHHKRHDWIMAKKSEQPLTGNFRGVVCLGVYAGHSPVALGAICDPAAFARIVEVPTRVLGPRHGYVAVDLLEPGCEPTKLPEAKIAKQQMFRDEIPWLSIRVSS